MLHIALNNEDYFPRNRVPEFRIQGNNDMLLKHYPTANPGAASLCADAVSVLSACAGGKESDAILSNSDLTATR